MMLLPSALILPPTLTRTGTRSGILVLVVVFGEARVVDDVVVAATDVDVVVR